MADRISYLDTSKALAISLVVFGHVLMTYHPCHYHSVVAEYIYSFHTAFFMFISGMFLSNALKKDIKTLAFQKSRQLLLPYLSWSLICFLITHSGGGISWNNLLQSTLHGYWYIKLLFLYTIVTALLAKTLKNTRLACTGSYFLFTVLPAFSFSNIFIPFFLAGYIHKEFYLNKMNNGILVGLIAIVILLYSIWDSSCNYNLESVVTLQSYLIRTSIGVIMSICIIQIMKKAEPFTPQNMEEVLLNIGSITLGIYLSHELFYTKVIWDWIFGFLPATTLSLLVYSIWVLFLSVGVVWLLSKNRLLSFLFLGKELKQILGRQK